MTSVSHPESVLARLEGDVAVIELVDALDATAGAALVAAVESALEGAPDRVDIDLQRLRSWTQGGVWALVRCREICRDLPGGLHYRTGRGPGREALLAAYA